MKNLTVLFALLSSSIGGYCQPQLSGQVKDKYFDNPIKAAKVSVIGRKVESRTDSLGLFTIQASAQDSLLIECPGYVSSKVAATNTAHLLIKLEGTFPIFTVVDEQTSFPGGLSKFYEYLNSNLRRPKWNNHGKMWVLFVVDTTGLMMQSETKATKEMNKNLPANVYKNYHDEIIRLINASPAWISARQSGKKVRQRMVFPVPF